MQSNIFAQVAPLLEERQFNIDCSAVVEFLSRYKSGGIIYPGAMHRTLRLDMRMVYAILELLTENGLLEQRLELYCPRCQRFTGKIYKTVSELPEFVNCIHCDEEIENPIQHAVVIYQVK